MIRNLTKFTKFSKFNRISIPKNNRYLAASNKIYQEYKPPPNTTVIDDNFDEKALEAQIKKIQAQIKLNETQEKTKKEFSEENISESKDEEKIPTKPVEFISESVESKFKAETTQLLNIVAESLYSDPNMFIREFISNANDAIEKARLELNLDKSYQINVYTNKQDNTITFQDNGIGMTKSEVEDYLGTIAKSGSKKYALDSSEKEENLKNIIGQFGVGFYSAFMVGSNVKVYTKKENEEIGTFWESDGISNYTTREAKNIDYGTKVVICLKPKHREFTNSEEVLKILEKNSSYSRSQILLNGKKLEMKKPIWNLAKNELNDEKHEEFYKYISNSVEGPRWTLQYNSDMPLSIKSLFYVPKGRPSMMETQKVDTDSDGSSNIALYSRNVLVQKNSSLVPRWLRFLRGVVDCEDIPLNLSRELLQDQVLIKSLKTTITNRIIKFFADQARKTPSEYQNFFSDYKIYLMQGILEEQDVNEREKMLDLIMYESSNLEKGELTSFADYKKRMKDGQFEIIYLYANNRKQAEASSYFEALKNKNYEVLFCYDTYDDFAISQVQSYQGTKITSAENVISSEDDANSAKKDAQKKSETLDLNKIEKSKDVENLVSWATNEMAGKCSSVEISENLKTQPAMITVFNLSQVRLMVKQQRFSNLEAGNDPQDQINDLLFGIRPKLLINQDHPLVDFAVNEFEQNPELSKKILEHLLNWSLVSAGLVDDAKALMDNTNELLLEITKAGKNTKNAKTQIVNEDEGPSDFTFTPDEKTEQPKVETITISEDDVAESIKEHKMKSEV